MTSALHQLVSGLEWVILFYFLAVNAFYVVLFISATIELRSDIRAIRGESRWRVLGSRVAPRISVLAPAYNEAATIRESLSALLALYYPNLEIVVVNDGSKDETMSVLLREFALRPVVPIYQQRLQTQPVRGLYRSALYPNLLVADKENGGKADALNAALNMVSGSLVCAIDSDTLIEPDALQRMVRPFLIGDNTLAAGGTIRVANGSDVRRGRVVNEGVPRVPLAGVQMVEYLRAFLFGRLGWNRLGGNLIISGAFGLFRREAMIGVGGYAHDTVGEDMELVLRLRRRALEAGKPHLVEFIPDPVAWTEVPESLRTLGRQRDRWQRGLADALWRHRGMVLNPRYGAVGMIALPYFVFVELLAPVIEVIGIIGLIVGLLIGAINWPFAALFFLVAYGLGIIFSLLTVLLDEVGFTRVRGIRNRLIIILWALGENLGYRQLTVLWRMRGLWNYLRGSRDWGRMERRGFASTEAAPSQDEAA